MDHLEKLIVQIEFFDELPDNELQKGGKIPDPYQARAIQRFVAVIDHAVLVAWHADSGQFRIVQLQKLLFVPPLHVLLLLTYERIQLWDVKRLVVACCRHG